MIGANLTEGSDPCQTIWRLPDVAADAELKVHKGFIFAGGHRQVIAVDVPGGSVKIQPFPLPETM